MPEGHTIHRYARRHRRALAGQEVAVSSPQGRFSKGAARLDGRRLETVEAVGKHLFYSWKGGDILHIHLGLFGRFRLYRDDPPPPTDNTRLAMSADHSTVYLSGPSACELLDPAEEEALRSRLGPDPIAEPGEGDSFVANLGRRRIPVGAAMLDQRVIAGVGNVYRSELLFLCDIDPRRPAASLDGGEARRLWAEAVTRLQAGERSGRIVTVAPIEVGAKRVAEMVGEERLYVYKRTGLGCRRCGTPIQSTELGGRAAFFCPTCQS